MGGASVQDGLNIPGTIPVIIPYPFSSAYNNGETDNVLGGVSVRSSGANGELQLLTLSGSKNRNTRATTVSDGTYILVDGDGFDQSHKITDGEASLSLSANAPNFTSSRSFAQTYFINGITFDSVGVIGVVTGAGGMPTAGTATYRGQSELLAFSTEAGISMKGQSTIVANFGDAGRVNVTLNGFIATDLVTGARTTSPVDVVNVNDMVISGNSFSGGTITTIQGNAVVSLTGANTTAAASGAFFGLNSTLTGPDEIGGVILVQGDDGALLGNFVAD